MLFARLRRFFFSPVCPKQLPQEHVQQRWNQTPRNISRAVESQNRTARSARQYPACLKEQGPCGESGSRAKAGGGGPSDPSERFRAGSLAGFQSRSPVFRLWSRSSSGYFSFDSEPSSPIITHNTATQTPSPSSQAITHFLQRISHAHNHELWPALYNHYPPHGAAPAGDMHVEFDVERHWREVAQTLGSNYPLGRSAQRHADALEAQLLIWTELSKVYSPCSSSTRQHEFCLLSAGQRHKTGERRQIDMSGRVSAALECCWEKSQHSQ
ncbi:hypothetical protein C0J45_2185 [Silurus meridionalis]|nr:hypothetical protein C0J45_2185 [Silurus meridionalis]